MPLLNTQLLSLLGRLNFAKRVIVVLLNVLLSEGFVTLFLTLLARLEVVGDPVTVWVRLCTLPTISCLFISHTRHRCLQRASCFLTVA